MCLSSRSRARRIFHRERGCLRRQSANALVNSLAWFFGITGILETFSVSRTAYWEISLLKWSHTDFTGYGRQNLMSNLDSRSELPFCACFQWAEQHTECFSNLNNRKLTFRITVGEIGYRIRIPRDHLPLKGTRKAFSTGVQMKEREILIRKVVWTISSKFLVFEKRASEGTENSCRKSTCGV